MILGKIANGYYGSFDKTNQTYVDNISSVKLSNTMFKEFMIGKDINIVPSTEYPSEWNYKLIMHANFANGTYDAGNLSFNLENTTDILIKKREKGTFTWQTIFHKKIDTVDDFNFNIYDYYSRNNVTYEYAIVQVNGNVEGEYITSECDSKFEGSYMIGKNEIFRLLLDLKVDRSMNAPRAFIAGLNKTVPKVVKNSQAKYQRGSVTTTIVDYDFDNKEFKELDSWRMRDAFMDFLYDRNAKFFKTFDNKVNYIVEIEDGASEDNSFWNAPTTSFSFVQIGSAESERDMVNSGLLDLDAEWWSI